MKEALNEEIENDYEASSEDEEENSEGWDNFGKKKCWLDIAHVFFWFFLGKKGDNDKFSRNVNKIKSKRINELMYVVSKGQVNSEWIYEVIVSPKIQT